jgi:phosphoribosylformylglycinamidine synthase subunit PurQ / glutaminase
VTVQPRIGVVTFPGSLDDRDALRAARFLGAESVSVWHADEGLPPVDGLILPGGFSYGDYLRTGAIARFARVMDAITAFAGDGGPVLGVCNGFQILCEAGLLPGALIRNRSLSFVCRVVHLRTENRAAGFQDWPDGEIVQMPVKHGEGQFVASRDVADLEANGQVILRYCSPAGRVSDQFNPNGATNGIAGIRNERGNVIGLMPHPEHAVDPDVGPTGGQLVFEWLFASARSRVEA